MSFKNKVKVVGTVVGTDWKSRGSLPAVLTYRIRVRDGLSGKDGARDFTCFAVLGHCRKDPVLFSGSLMGKRVVAEGKLCQYKSDLSGWDSQIMLDVMRAPEKEHEASDCCDVKLEGIVRNVMRTEDSSLDVLLSMGDAFDAPCVSCSVPGSLSDSEKALFAEGSRVHVTGKLSESRFTEIFGINGITEYVDVGRVRPFRSMDVAPVKETFRGQESCGMEW